MIRACQNFLKNSWQKHLLRIPEQPMNNKSRKIWLMTSEFPPLSGGGISTYCFETVNMFVRQGHEIIVFTQDTKTSGITESDRGSYRLVTFNPDNFYTAAFLGYEANLAFAFSEVIKKYMESEGVPDVLESQEYLGICYYVLQFRHLGYELFSELRVLITLHSPSFLYLEYNKVIYHRLPYYWVGEMEKACMHAADMLISPSAYLVPEINSRLNRKLKDVHVLVNPYDVNEAFRLKPSRAGKIVFFGKLTPQKGILEVLRYFEKLWSEGFKQEFVVIGGGNHLYHPEGIDMIDFLRRKYSEQIKIGRLRFTGPISPQEIEREIGDAAVVVIPSIIDNLPYTVLEVMALGRLVLVSKQGGQSEVVTDGVDGFVFDHDDPASFGVKLAKLLSLDQDSSTQVMSAARERIKAGYSHESVYTRKNILLDQLVASPAPSLFPFIEPPAKNSHLGSNTYNDPLLTVVIPFFNMGAFLEEAVQSVIRSSYQQLEIVIVNDGSTEKESMEVLDKMALHKQVRIIHQENQGLPAARNCGALAAAGQWLAFLDPDDSVEPSYYTKAIRVLESRANVTFVGCWARYFGANSACWPAFNPEPPFLLVHNMINSSALVYRKSAFLESGMNDSRMVFGMEDYESVISMVENGRQGVVLPELLWNYRIRKNSMARSFTRDKQLYLYRLISLKHKAIFARYADEVANLLNANGPGIEYDNPTLLYAMPKSWLLSNNASRKLISVIKSNPVLRKYAIRLKKKIFKG
ncbi:MAG: glycosyltransferase [Chitinophagaceae bacterium]|nr:MAG: glycosyltransferase [Chitinophagaceae bacterium]